MKKNNKEVGEIHYELDFDDRTILEGEGDYDKIVEIMQEEEMAACGWMLETNVIIKSEFGAAHMVLHFYSNGDVYITDFTPSTPKDVLYNPDIRCISMWIQQKGWKNLKPHPDLVKDNIELWRHFWEINLIESDLLRSKFGQRASERNDDIEEEDDL